MDFSQTLAKWYLINKRDLPWRNTRDPYLIWLSEVILQQTRVDQGLPYYLRFAEAFPDVAELAAAEEDHVLKLWQGLGYYSRARNMLATARTVMRDHAGRFPSSYAELIRLKGIGEYTASAIASFARGEACAVVDGNVYRVLARYFGIELPIDTGKGKAYFAELARELLDRNRPELHNQAIMEFGAVQCKPKGPGCMSCPLATTCVAYRENRVGEFPVKARKSRSRDRYFNYLVIRRKGGFWLNKRPEGDIWQSLYEFPMIETPAPLDTSGLFSLEAFRKILKGKDFLVISVSETIRHVLSHQVIYARFWELQLQEEHKPEGAFLLVSESEAGNYAFPKLIANYLENKL